MQERPISGRKIDRRRRALSLVELLVVAAIIMIAMSMLFGVLFKAYHAVMKLRG
jgi:type II secretory pathway pseudopilin PulG